MKTYSASVFSTEKYDLGESPFYDIRTLSRISVQMMQRQILMEDFGSVRLLMMTFMRQAEISFVLMAEM